ncbi:MAG: protease family protein [Chloroflexota bacterium]|jgi:membrane protease YdiL (CAAX protease family)|nr:protease family protein [Chloroflexota bacterium]
MMGASALRALLTPMLGEPGAGLAFALVLLVAVVVSRTEPGNRRPAALIVGAAVGATLLLPGLWLHWAGLPPRAWYIPAPALAGYSAALLLIVPAEELFLRGALQPEIRRALGPGAAIGLTALLFAAIHVMAYGVVAIPLDFGVGLLLGWLRERTGSTAACIVAHLLADLGSWWLP